MMQNKQDIFTQLDEQGFVVIDNFLKQEEFSEMQNLALESWETKKDWVTSLNIGKKRQDLPFHYLTHNSQSVNSIKVAKAKDDSIFTYLYHTLNQINDTGEVVKRMFEILVKDSLPLLLELPDVLISRRYFFISCYTKRCNLDWHTDAPVKTNPYRLAINFYLYSNCVQSEFNLHFDYKGKKSMIEPQENRCVIFKPCLETNHGVFATENKVKDGQFRLALTGFLLD